MSADVRSNVQAFDADGVAGRFPRALIPALSLLAGVLALLALAPLAQALPAGRGYEMVSPVEKDGQDMMNGINKAAVNGDAFASLSFGAFADSESGGLVTSYHSGRSATDWTTEALGPPQAVFVSLGSSIFQDFSEDVSTSIVAYQGGDPNADGATPDTNNIYIREPDGTLELLTPNQPPPTSTFPPSPTWGGGPDDMSFGAFTMNTDPPATVTSGPAATPGVDNAFSSNGDDLRLVSVLPNGTASPDGGFIGGGGFGALYNVVSGDGSRVFWSTAGFTIPTELYVRIDGTSTEHASEDQRTTPDPNGVQPKNYQYATPDGDFVYFSSSQKLTNNAQAEPGLPDLYRYDVTSGALVDLTTADPDGAGFQGLLGVSNSGSRVYFAATGALAPGAVDGEVNLYVRDGATTTFITGLDPSFDADNWNPNGAVKSARVSGNGGVLMFSSRRSQLGYDNAGFLEFYRYDAAADDFACMSCRPGGAPATADAAINSPPTGGLNLQLLGVYERRNLSSDGSTAFFTSPEPLRIADSNGQYDTYMWKDGVVSLVSSGQSAHVSAFSDASADGNDAFFLTRERLVGIDTDDQVDLYDARVGGGLASQNPPPPPPPCTGDTCKPAPTPQTGPPNSGTASVTGTEPPGAGPDCSSFEQKATKSAAKAKQKKQKVKQLKKKGAPKKKIKKAKQKSKQAKQAAKEAKQAANECQNA